MDQNTDNNLNLNINPRPIRPTRVSRSARPILSAGRLPKLSKLSKMTGQNLALTIAAFVAVAVLATAGIFAVNYFKNKDDSAQITSEVKAIFPYLLPSDKPTVATVTDISKLQGQEFFRNAQNGDRVLVFSASRVAIIYRRQNHAIINFGPITANPAAAATPAPVVTPAVVTPAPAKTATPTPKR